ncbi:MAG: hypothetical protein U1F45_02075 [Burkholderiales bacterium]
MANVANDPLVNIVPWRHGDHRRGRRARLLDRQRHPHRGWATRTPGQLLEVTLTAVQGTLTLAGTSGLTSRWRRRRRRHDDLTGTIADINAALDGMSSPPLLDYDGLASVSITTGDLGATGGAGAQSDGDTVDITVVVVDDAPTLDLTRTTARARSAPITCAVVHREQRPGAHRRRRRGAGRQRQREPRVADRHDLPTLDGVDEILTMDTTGTHHPATYNSVTGVLTPNGADTVANYQQVLHGAVRERVRSAEPRPAGGSPLSRATAAARATSAPPP